MAAQRLSVQSTSSSRCQHAPARCSAGALGSHGLSRLRACRRPLLHVVRAQGDEADQVEGPLESIFAKELARRGYSPGSSLSSLDSEEGAAVAEKPASPFAPVSSSQSPFQSATKTTPRSSTRQQAPSGGAEGQRERSMALVSEGLEGLIPRATELLKLGGSVFLAFLPFIAGISILFGAIYLVMGDSFVHGGGVNSGPPPYVDPEKLLSEPTLDPYIPFR